MRPILAAILSASLVMPAAAHAVPKEPAGPLYLTAKDAMASVSLHHDVIAGRFVGTDASELLRAVNDTGDKTDFQAETLIVVLYPDRAVVALFGVCHTGDVAMSLPAFKAAWDRLETGRV